MNDNILQLNDEDEQESKDWVATVRITDRLQKSQDSNFENSEEKADIARQMRKIERAESIRCEEASEELDLTGNEEYAILSERLAAIVASESHVSWEDDVEAKGLPDEKAVEIMILSKYYSTWGRFKYKGKNRYIVEITNISEKLIQEPRLIVS